MNAVEAQIASVIPIFEGDEDDPPVGVADGPVIAEGQRNASLTSHAGRLRRIGLSVEAIEAALLVINEEQCRPPLREAEVVAIARSVGRYDADASTPPAVAPLAVLSAADVQAAPAPPEIVEGALWGGCVTVMVSESGTGKTFAALDIAAHISDGVPWLGRSVAQGSVVHAGFEGDALGRRLTALSHAQGHRLEHVYIIHASEPISPVTSRDGETISRGEAQLAAALRELAARVAAEGHPIRMLTIDTIRASSNGSEDDSGDAANYLRAVRRLLSCIPEAGALLTHHAGWQDGETKRRRERGSSAWRGNSDAVLYLAAAGDYDRDSGEAALVLEARKTRDAEQPPPLRLIRRRVYLPEVDRRGDPVTSCVIELDRRSTRDLEAETERKAEAELQAVDRRVLCAIRDNTITSKDQLTAVLRMRKAVVSEACNRILAAGLAYQEGQRKPFRLTEGGHAAIR